MATPCVAGIAALMMAAKPGTTAQQVRELLQSTATDLGTAGKVRARRLRILSV
jgi:subtilisin family serine protease